MLKVRYSAQFKKDFKLAKKRGLPLQESNRNAQRFIGIIDFPAQKAPKHRGRSLGEEKNSIVCGKTGKMLY